MTIPVTNGAGSNVSTHVDTTSLHHQKTLIEYLGPTDPQPVGYDSPLPSARVAVNKGGSTPFHRRTLNSAGVDISTGPAMLYGFNVYNTNAGTTDVYVKFYNKAVSTVSLSGSGEAPFAGPYLVPAGGSLVENLPEGLEFNARIGVRIVTGLADNSTVDPTANEVLFNARFKQ